MAYLIHTRNEMGLGQIQNLFRCDVRDTCLKKHKERNTHTQTYMCFLYLYPKQIKNHLFVLCFFFCILILNKSKINQTNNQQVSILRAFWCSFGATGANRDRNSQKEEKRATFALHIESFLVTF